jgi:thymidylate synthase
MQYEDNWRKISPRLGKETYEWREPVMIRYSKPFERVLLCPVRDANPFFHLMEAIWMMSGRNDLEFISQFTNNMSQFSDDGRTLNGAYGFRWRDHFGEDQLLDVRDLLNEEPDTRRAVITMWDPTFDLCSSSLDIPCNTHIYFKIRENNLHMTVCNRSNDIVWGAFGANAVHFSVLMEWMANATSSHIGVYTHIADSWHYYTDNPFIRKVNEGTPIPFSDYYLQAHGTSGKVTPMSMVNIPAVSWLSEAEEFCNGWYSDLTDVFFIHVAMPMLTAWSRYKDGDIDGALSECRSIVAADWKRACTEWLQRRKK